MNDSEELWSDGLMVWCFIFDLNKLWWINNEIILFVFVFELNFVAFFYSFKFFLMETQQQMALD